MILMHCLSTLIGTVFILFVPKLWIQIFTIVLFLGMGIFAISLSIRKLCCKKKNDSDDSSDEEAELAAVIAENEAENNL